MREAVLNQLRYILNLGAQESGCQYNHSQWTDHCLSKQMVANNIRFLKVEPEIQQRKMLNSFVMSAGQRKILSAPMRIWTPASQVLMGDSYFLSLSSVVAMKLGCRLKVKLRRLKEGVKCPLCSTDLSPAKNPAGNRHFFSRWISPASGA